MRAHGPASRSLWLRAFEHGAMAIAALSRDALSGNVAAHVVPPVARRAECPQRGSVCLMLARHDTLATTLAVQPAATKRGDVAAHGAYGWIRCSPTTVLTTPMDDE